MPRAYLIAEASNKAFDPTKGSATYLFLTSEHIVQYFEPWYVEENYVCISDDGKRWKLETDGTCMSLLPWSDGVDYRDLFKAWFADWITAHAELVGSSDALAAGSDSVYEEILNDGEILKSVSSG